MVNDLYIHLLKDAFFSAVAAAGFSIISNPPKRAILASALLAAIGHSFRLFIITMGVKITDASLVAALLMGSFSFLTASYIRVPNEVFTFPSLLPMIPGMFAYKSIISMISFIKTGEEEVQISLLINSLHNGATALSILFALVLGISIPVMLFHRYSYQVTRKRWPWKWR